MATNKLIIIGGGAAGLMAAVTAYEKKLPALLLERRHRPGLKLLLCGNNRCNISHDASAAKMLQDYGTPVGEFLKAAITAFPPDRLREWFARMGLSTIVKRDRIYPKTENSDDVLHCFLDIMREEQIPYVLNCPVKCVAKENDIFTITTENGLFFQSEKVLIATGGFSYPKTGSVGDGQRIAAELNHSIIDPLPGLAGVDCEDRLLAFQSETDIPDVAVTVLAAGRPVARTRGNILCTGSILRGSAIFDATRAIARQKLTEFSIQLDFCPALSTPPENLSRLPLPPALVSRLAKKPSWVKSYNLQILGIRPLKEAIVSVGGVSLEEINPETMESKILPGLYFAGEVMDIDGPTGGYNLHAAFATARLAIDSMTCVKKAKTMPQRPASKPPRPQSPRERYGDPRKLSRRW
ncbi:MAG: aminoacetone oxidase family FAD-binding enzyme [Victivallales bacterium]|nr:aminoacetone oxidase family FAD-binding enzyme [Victivallales bacterium]